MTDVLVVAELLLLSGADARPLPARQSRLGAPPPAPLLVAGSSHDTLSRTQVIR
jgi:hypothetical protein